MSEKARQIIYWGSTVMMCMIFLFSATMYFVRTDMIMGYFEMLNYPPYLVYPLAVVKILGVVAVLSNKSKMLKEWAYAGFFFDAVLAATAHYSSGDGGEMMSLLAIVMIILSRVFWNKGN